MVTNIHEFPHPRVVTIFNRNPDDGKPETEGDFTDALDWGASGFEFHIRYDTGTQRLILAHDSRQINSAVAAADIMEVLKQRVVSAATGTVQDDARQFFIVVEVMVIDDFQTPNQPGPQALYALLDAYRSYLSTAVAATGCDSGPRPLTVLLSGKTGPFYQAYQSQDIASLALREGVTYTSDHINNLVPAQQISWYAFHWPDEVPSVNAYHLTDQGNVRAYYDHSQKSPGGVTAVIATGLDADTPRAEDFAYTVTGMQSQYPQADSENAPLALAAGDGTALATWVSGSGHLYAAIGSLSTTSLLFTRQLNLSSFLPFRFVATDTAAAVTPDGAMFVIVVGKERFDPSNLFCIAGAFTRPDRFLTFKGSQDPLAQQSSCSSSDIPMGFHQSVALGPRRASGWPIIIAYEGTHTPNKLFYFSGWMDPTTHAIAGCQHGLTDDAGLSGNYPSVTFDATGKVLLVYTEADSMNLRYVYGGLASGGQLEIQAQNKLTTGDSRTEGYAASVSVRNDNFVALAYQDGERTLYYMTARLVPNATNNDAVTTLTPHQLTSGPSRRGYRPSLAFCDGNGAVIFYEGTNDGRMWYVLGTWATSQALVGWESMLNMALGETRHISHVRFVAATTIGTNLFVVVLDEAGGLWQTIRSGADGSWRRWDDVDALISGHSTAGKPALTRIAASATQLARMINVVGVDQAGGLRHAGTWESWENLFAEIPGSQGVGLAKLAPAATSSSGELHVMLVTRTDGLWHASRPTGGSWAPWEDLLLKIGKPGTGVAQPCATAITGPGDLHLLVIDRDNMLWHALKPAGASDWTTWGNVLAQMDSRKLGTVQWVCATTTDSDLHVLVIDPTSTLWRTKRLSTGKWDAWDPVASHMSGDAGPIQWAAVAANAEGDLHILVVNDADKLLHTIRAATGIWQSAWGDVAAVVPST